jgi:outer membrane biogenesis lipoprotein LolB
MIGRAAVLLFSVLLGACATVPAPQPLPQLESAPTAFEMSGRLALRQGDRSDIARLRWTRTKAGDLWVIASPLGNEVARIESGPKGASLVRAGAPAESAPDFRSLSDRLLGVALDPRDLANWLHAPLGGLSSAGWTVQVEEAQAAGKVTIARRIAASRGEVSVRLVVDDYRALGE